MERNMNAFLKKLNFGYSSEYDDAVLRKSFEERHIFNNAKTVVDYYLDEELHKNHIVLLGLGHHVKGNLMYILDELNHNPRYEGFQIFIRTLEDTDDEVRTFIKQRKWERTETVFKNNVYMKHLESAKYLLTETFFPRSWMKKDGQIVISIWHGTPLKMLGLTMKMKTIQTEGRTQKFFIASDYQLYPNHYTYEHMRNSFRISNLMQGKSLFLGYPRTVGILNSEGIDSIRRRLAPNGEQVYAYMPTWRDYQTDDEVVEMVQRFLNYMDAHLTDTQLLYVNLHHKVEEAIHYEAYSRIRPFLADIDSYQLLAASDGLVTDYSSVFFDYLASGKNIVLYCPDLDVYEEKRGLYFDIRDLPFPVVSTAEETLQALAEGKRYDDREAKEKFCEYDSLDNAKKLCQLFDEDESGLVISQEHSDDRRKVLLFSDEVSEQAQTDFIGDLYEKAGAAGDDVYLSYRAEPVDEDPCGAYPMIAQTKSIGVYDPIRYNKNGKEVIIGYLEHKRSLEEVSDLLQPVYRANFIRNYGADCFDQYIVAGTVDGERILMFRAMNRKLHVVVKENMIESMKNGNRLLRDALDLLLKDGFRLYVSSGEARKEIKKLLRQYKRSSIYVYSNADELIRMMN